ncbi:hypothetical protein LVJ94_46730 [Pendulispora rubella]|uniref:Secreted protein n=1 Tax=Pendulispora rubella TaxID=2741070 RepID=A0ABZ2L0E4_9BACT
MLQRPPHPLKKRAPSIVRAATVSALAVGLGLTALASCGEGSHVYGARAYDRARGCLGPTQTLDVVSGDDPSSNCALKCLVPRAGEAVVYVSQQCPPYPPQFDTSGLQSGCDQAIAAFERGDFCLTDGGSTHPGPDAGGTNNDGGTAQDATIDAASDASDAASDAPDGSDASDGNVTDA